MLQIEGYSSKNNYFRPQVSIFDMKSFGIKLSLYVNYFVFAILLNSVGIVILKAINRYQVGEVEASTLEVFIGL